jgi:hypothetical protein
VQVETAASTTGAVVGTRFDVPLATRVEERASPAGARRPRAGRWYIGIVRSFAAASQRVTMQRADLTTRRRLRPSARVASTSRRPRVGSCDHDRSGRRVHARRLARGSRRWAIRWAKPGRIGPYRAITTRPRRYRILPICRYFRARRRHERHASHARGRWFEPSRAHCEGPAGRDARGPRPRQVFAVLVAVWCLAGLTIGSHRAVIRVVERAGVRPSSPRYGPSDDIRDTEICMGPRTRPPAARGACDHQPGAVRHEQLRPRPARR